MYMDNAYNYIRPTRPILQYWSDNCGGDEEHTAEWYCRHCDQEECCKRVARRIRCEVNI